MKTAHQINDSFRKQIRNRQKQQLFRSIRNNYAEQNVKKGQMMMAENNQNINNNSSAAYLQKLICQVKNSDGVKICNKILDQGIHQNLIQNLKKNVDVEISLQLISAILTKQKVKIANKFVRLGLIQQIIRLSQFRQNVDICMNILSNIVFQNVEYAQMMLQNSLHKHLFELFRRIVLTKQKIDKADEESGFLIMWALAAFLEIQNTISYKQPFLEILEFALEVFKKQLYIRLIIQIIFLVGYSFREETQNAATWVIKSILDQCSTQTSYLENLLILVKLLSPLNIDYGKISTLAMTAQGKLISYCLRILQKVAKTHTDAIPKNFEWWQRLYLKLTKPQDIEYYTSMLTKTRIKSQFIYRILNDILQKYCPSYLTLTNEVLICINCLLENTQGVQDKRKIKFYLKSSNIVYQLERLYECKNHQINKKCQYLLTAVSSNF